MVVITTSSYFNELIANFNTNTSISIISNESIPYKIGTVTTVYNKNIKLDDEIAKTLPIYSCFDFYVPAFDESSGILLFKNLEEAEKQGYKQTNDRSYLLRNAKYSKTNARFQELDPRVKDYIEPVKLGSKSPTYLISNKMRYTFGVEIETINGRLPYWVYFNNGLSLQCARDGSLRNPDGSETGGEYISGILTGDQGFFNLKKSLVEISKRCNIDPRCGIHVHVGNCTFNSKFIVLAYILALKLEDEVFETLPPSRRNNETCGRLFREDYEKIIKSYNLEHGVEICYEDLFVKMSNGRKLDKVNNRSLPHPGGRYCDRYSRNISPAKLYRYKWINFIPTSFNMKGTDENPVYTLEFRSHPASLNYDKIMKWILFCFAFCNYVENNSNEIISKDNITINDVLSYSFKGHQLENLILYFDDRKKKFADKDATIVEHLEYKQKTASKTDSFIKFVESCV